VIGYDKAVVIAHKASDEGTLRQAALATGYVSAAEFDRGARPDQRIRPIWCGGEVDSAMTSARQGVCWKARVASSWFGRYGSGMAVS
jgi:hypothetical protein